ncbi:hypothetical protein B296_00033308 [Ensete ventricosum]|uniref:Uncharacterized protein n=1 Tax=Ensete ventricosum TaxID=4639 RepID=A0A427A475_ENSVE|nr:hypothetical protein B296_00033308 [Ensete ventricosum]
MPMNLKEGDCYVVNHGEDLTTVDFNGYVSLAEKEDVGMVGRRDPTRDRPIAAVEDSAGSDERLMKEKVVGSRECSDRGGSGFDGSRRALLGGEGAVGQRSYPITIEQRGGARCLYCSRKAPAPVSLPLCTLLFLPAALKYDGSPSKCARRFHPPYFHPSDDKHWFVADMKSSGWLGLDGASISSAVAAAGPYLLCAVALVVLLQQLSYLRKKGSLPGPTFVVPFLSSPV